MKLRSTPVLGLALAVLVSSVGCVAQREADNLRTLYRKSQEQVIDLQAQLEEASARIAALQAATPEQDPALLLELEAAISERDRLREALAEAEARLRDASATVVLPPELDSALADLAESNPNLMTYDPQQGMVRFRSDLTFALGSAEVSEPAAESLGQLARVVSSPIASPYEVRIVGHTDNVRIANPATRAKHPTNWHLSAHRAIAVKDVLQSAGVAPTRMSVAGYGEYRPIVPNGPGGAEANRRVEIFLVERTAPAEPTPQAPAPAEPEPQGAAPEPDEPAGPTPQPDPGPVQFK